jgi:acyl transferase domain-containing protein
VILKLIDEALKNGDLIRAVIRNTGINHDGKTPGVTFPSAKAQEALARQVYAQAGLDPLETTYIESHGTGTQAGDPVEASALFMTFGKNRSDPIQVGSVKSNVGHLVSLTFSVAKFPRQYFFRVVYSEKIGSTLKQDTFGTLVSKYT